MTTATTKKAPELQAQLRWLRANASSRNASGMARFGIRGQKVLGISVTKLRARAKTIGRDHVLAAKLWRTGIHEARLMACFIEDVDQLTEKQMDTWVNSFDSWDICDQACNSVFCYTSAAWKKAKEWAREPEEFVRRAGFVMMAGLAVHDARAHDEKFIPFFRLILKYSDDDRNYVRKAVNWALRQTGKRNQRLGKLAVHAAKLLSQSQSPSARWIGRDALREFKLKGIV